MAAIGTRQDLEPVPCSRGTHVLAALAAKPPEVALIRLRLPDMDGLDVLHRIRAVSPGARAHMLLDENEIDHREACFRSGCEDVLFAPIDGEDVARRLAGADELRFRREPRVPFGAPASLVVGGVAKEVVAESLSEMGLRLRWSEAPPARAIVPITLELNVGASSRVWVRLEDVASRKGVSDGLMARFVGLNAAERGAVRAALERLRGVRSGPLEAPGVPVLYDLSKPPAEVTAYSRLPEEPAPPGGRRRFTGILASFLGVAAVGSSAWAWVTIQETKHPERHYDPKPERIVDGLRLRRVNRMPGGRVVAMVDASWWDLSDEGRERAVTTLATDVELKDDQALEVWTVKGRVAAATLDSSGALAIVRDPAR